MPGTFRCPITTQRGAAASFQILRRSSVGSLGNNVNAVSAPSVVESAGDVDMSTVLLFKCVSYLRAEIFERLITFCVFLWF